MKEKIIMIEKWGEEGVVSSSPAPFRVIFPVSVLAS